MMIQIIAAVIATVGFSVLFGVPSKYYPYCGVIGGAGWLVYLLTLEHFRTAGVSLAATMVVIFLSRLAAVRKKCPVTIFLIAGIFPLVPGAGVAAGMTEVKPTMHSALTMEKSAYNGSSR